MNYKKLGNTKIDVSTICLGTMTWGEQNTMNEGFEQMDFALDNGVNFAHTFSSINMTDIEFHTTNTNIIYGASKGNTSIYKSVDNGITWSVSGTGLPSTGSVVRACVAVTPDNPSVVYALFGDNNNGYYGVYRSVDEGQTWSQQSNSPNLLGWSTTGSDNDGQAWYDLAFAVDPNNEQILFVGGVNSWKSVDGGQNWSLNTHWTGSGGADYVYSVLLLSLSQSSQHQNWGQPLCWGLSWLVKWLPLWFSTITAF